MIQIDGSFGEGGGQILRSALTLSLVTGKPVEIKNIRARRRKPGLMPQHLNAVEAAATVGKAEVEGAHLHSQSLTFKPSKICSAEFHFDVGTAGSVPLVLQTIFLPLSFASGSSSITLTGGTHTPWSPCFHYLDWHWLSYMKQIGFDATFELELAGFYPKGGGRMHADVRPAKKLLPLTLTDRGELKSIRGISAIANLADSVGERQRQQALKRLGTLCDDLQIDLVRMPSLFRSTMLLLIANFEKSQACFYGLGAIGKRAERVADEAVDQLRKFLPTDGAIDHHLADQLILPLSFVPAVSEMRPDRITEHLTTNAEIIKMFLPVSVEMSGKLNECGTVKIEGIAVSDIRPSRHGSFVR